MELADIDIFSYAVILLNDHSKVIVPFVPSVYTLWCFSFSMCGLFFVVTALLAAFYKPSASAGQEVATPVHSFVVFLTWDAKLIFLLELCF